MLLFKKFSTDIVKVLDVATIEKLFDVGIAVNNQACISEAMKPVLYDSSKPVDLQYQVLVDHVRKSNSCLDFVSTDEIAPNILTNNVCAQNFKDLLG